MKCIFEELLPDLCRGGCCVAAMWSAGKQGSLRSLRWHQLPHSCSVCGSSVRGGPSAATQEHFWAGKWLDRGLPLQQQVINNRGTPAELLRKRGNGCLPTAQQMWRVSVGLLLALCSKVQMTETYQRHDTSVWKAYLWNDPAQTAIPCQVLGWETDNTKIGCMLGG